MTTITRSAAASTSSAPISQCRRSLCAVSSSMFFVQQQERIGGQGGVVGDGAPGDHLLELVPAHPLLPHVLLFGLPVRGTWLEAGGQERVAALVGGPVGAVRQPERGQFGGPEAGLLGQFEEGQVFGLAGLAV